MRLNIIHLLKKYPLPIYTLMGLILGLIFYFLSQPIVARYVWYITIVLFGSPVVFKTILGMFKGQFASDIVAMLAIVTAILMDEPFAGAVVVLMQSGGEALESYGLSQATSSLKALLERSPHFAFKKVGENFEKIPVDTVELKDILLVRTGDLIPVDGTIVQGNAEIDESALTGEPLAHEKSEGDVVYSGTINVTGTFEMRADKLAKDSQYQKIVTLVAKAQEEKAPIQRLADKYAIFFTPLTLLMCILAYLFTKNPINILSVLVVATPCPLILATPLAILCGINKSAKSGIIVKGGIPMEKVGMTQAVVFDKTGTITFGTPQIEDIVSLDLIKENELLQIAASIEQYSTHSIAKAIVEKAKSSSLKLSNAQNFKESPGSGVEADLNNNHYTIGSHVLVQKVINQKIKIPTAKEKVLSFIAKNKTCIGYITISDRIRPGVVNLIQDLKTNGVKEIYLLTGDNLQNAQIIAKEAGIEKVKAELFPVDKVEIVKELRKNFNYVTMVGDGINDAPALASATVGIAMGAFGTAISAEAASVVLLVDDVTKVKEAISISQETLKIAKQSIFIGIGLSFCLMVIASFGHIQPAFGALLQEIIDFAVIVNALRIR